MGRVLIELKGRNSQSTQPNCYSFGTYVSTLTNCIITVQHLESAMIASKILIHTCLLHNMPTF